MSWSRSASPSECSSRPRITETDPEAGMLPDRSLRERSALGAVKKTAPPTARGLIPEHRGRDNDEPRAEHRSLDAEPGPPLVSTNPVPLHGL